MRNTPRHARWESFVDDFGEIEHELAWDSTPIDNRESFIRSFILAQMQHTLIGPFGFKIHDAETWHQLTSQATESGHLGPARFGYTGPLWNESDQVWVLAFSDELIARQTASFDDEALVTYLHAVLAWMLYYCSLLDSDSPSQDWSTFTDDVFYEEDGDALRILSELQILILEAEMDGP